MKLGVITDCFKKPLDESIVLAGKMGFDGVQIYATSGTFSPEVLTEETKAYYKKLLKDNNLVVSALCGDMGGHGFEIEADNAERIEKTKKIVDLAVEFGAGVVTTHIGVIPADAREDKYRVMFKALQECGAYAREKGVMLAIETGPENANVLHRFVSDISDTMKVERRNFDIKHLSGGVCVNLDPANFIMVTDQDPTAAVKLLGNYVVHTHLKDGKKLRKIDPKVVYDHFAEGGIEALNVADYFIETPLGEGNVNWKQYIQTLKDVGYKGFLTIERETGEDPIADIQKGLDFIKGIL